MTILQAVQAGIEYENGELVNKILLDVGLVGTDIYVPATHKNLVAEATAYIMIVAAHSPDFTESSRHIKFDAKTLLKQARSILTGLGIDPETVIGLSGSTPSVRSGGYM